jgi:hypothetical protein
MSECLSAEGEDALLMFHGIVQVAGNNAPPQEMRTPPQGVRLWLRLAFRFIRRHRRKSLATGSFIFTGAAILVLIHSITVGISDTMILNTTSLHYGEAFTEVRPGGEAPETLAAEIERKGLAETALVRYRFVSIIKKGSAFAPSVSFAVQP